VITFVPVTASSFDSLHKLFEKYLAMIPGYLCPPFVYSVPKISERKNKPSIKYQELYYNVGTQS
jgi:hypothetical protein